jgi:glycosyltransferase involved in cell wall biosynthesis
MVPRTHNLIEVIYNAGVDQQVLSGAKQPLSQEKLPETMPLILACGRLHPQKGFPYLLQAMQQVQKEVPCQLWIVGEGRERPALEAQIQQLDLADCVHLKGFQKNPYQYMAAADLFVLSSLYEGFGNVVAEAMACGTAVISTDCPYGPAEIIQDESSGILVPLANPDALAKAIIRVLTNPTLRQTLADNGRQRSRDFHAEVIAPAYANSFLNLLNRQKQESAQFEAVKPLAQSCSDTADRLSTPS